MRGKKRQERDKERMGEERRSRLFSLTYIKQTIPEEENMNEVPSRVFICQHILCFFQFTMS